MDLTLHLTRRPPYVPLFWRLFVADAAITAIAGTLLVVNPPEGRVPIIAAGVAIKLSINYAVARRLFTPLQRLSGAMAQLDPLRPGQRASRTSMSSQRSACSPMRLTR